MSSYASRDEANLRRRSRELARVRRAQASRRSTKRKGCLFGAVVAAVAALAGLFVLLGGSGEVERTVVYPWRYESIIASAAERHGVDPYLVCAVIKCESDWNPSAESHVGAQGLMQVMPDTAESLVNLGYVDPSAYDPNDLFDPQTSIEYGCACLEFLSSQLDTTQEIIAAYNAGIGTVQNWKERATGDFAAEIDYEETRVYLERVMAAYEEYRRIYPEQPLG